MELGHLNLEKVAERCCIIYVMPAEFGAGDTSGAHKKKGAMATIGGRTRQTRVGPGAGKVHRPERDAVEGEEEQCGADERLAEGCTAPKDARAERAPVHDPPARAEEGAWHEAPERKVFSIRALVWQPRAATLAARKTLDLHKRPMSCAFDTSCRRVRRARPCRHRRPLWSSHGRATGVVPQRIVSQRITADAIVRISCTIIARPPPPAHTCAVSLPRRWTISGGASCSSSGAWHSSIGSCRGGSTAGRVGAGPSLMLPLALVPERKNSPVDAGVMQQLQLLANRVGPWTERSKLAATMARSTSQSASPRSKDPRHRVGRLPRRLMPTS